MICRYAAASAGLLNIVRSDQVLPNHLQCHVKVILAGNASARGLTVPGKFNLLG